MTCLTTIARVVPPRTKRLLGILWWLKYAAVISHVRLVLMTCLQLVPHAEKRVFSE